MSAIIRAFVCTVPLALALACAGLELGAGAESTGHNEALVSLTAARNAPQGDNGWW
ncbi:hypothetical protein [Streptomyces sp. LN785]|uniref:hypothetical protein n=1 Tax=Streptomyces sp. LN785 TaxID=3112983 RepID=UPI003721A8AB